MYVYHTLFDNNKEYIGASTKEPNESQNYYGSHPQLLQDIRHNGVKLVKKVIICETQDIDYLKKCELTVIKKMKVVDDPKFYNQTHQSNFPNYGKTGKDHHWFGRNHSEETKKKISESHKGKIGMVGENHPLWGKKGKASPRYGMKHSDEVKKKMSESSKAEKSFWFGKTHSEETKTKISNAMKDSWAKRRVA